MYVGNNAEITNGTSINLYKGTESNSLIFYIIGDDLSADTYFTKPCLHKQFNNTEWVDPELLNE